MFPASATPISWTHIAGGPWWAYALVVGALALHTAEDLPESSPDMGR